VTFDYIPFTVAVMEDNTVFVIIVEFATTPVVTFV